RGRGRRGRGGAPGGGQRVLGGAREVPATARAVVQAARGAECHVDALTPCLCRQQRRQPRHQGLVPGGGDRGGRGQVGGRVGVVVYPSADPHRAVGEHHLA